MKYHEIIRVSQLLACSMVFTLLCHLIRQIDVVKLTEKAQFKGFLDVLVFFLKFLHRLRSGIYCFWEG